MSETFTKVIELVETRDLRVSTHGYKRLVTKSIPLSRLTTGIRTAEVIEDYPDYHAGPAVLVLYTAAPALHAMWGIEKGTDRPAVLVTAYWPEPGLWSADFRSRKP